MIDLSGLHGRTVMLRAQGPEPQSVIGELVGTVSDDSDGLMLLLPDGTLRAFSYGEWSITVAAEHDNELLPYIEELRTVLLAWNANDTRTLDVVRAARALLEAWDARK